MQASATHHFIVRHLPKAAAAVLFAISSPVHAQSLRDQPQEQAPFDNPPVRSMAPRPWLYVDDPTVASPRELIANTRVTAAGGNSDTRPFANNLVRTGAGFEVGAEAGLLPALSVAASVMTTAAAPRDQAGSFGASAGLRFAPFLGRLPATHLVLSAGGLREVGGNGGIWGRFTVAQDIGAARLAATGHVEHIFQQGRDGVDLMMMAGANYQVYGPLRLGVEYVAQDIEEAFDAEGADGGIRHFAGPVGSLEILSQRLSVVGGPSFGLTSHSPPVVGRIGIAYAF